MKIGNLLVDAVASLVFTVFGNAMDRLPGGVVATLMACAFLLAMLGVWYATRFLADMLSSIFA